MLPRDKNQSKNEEHAPRKDAPFIPTSDENVKAAYEQAEQDIEQDPDLSIHSPNDDLDEAETAKLGEDKTDLI